MADYERRRDEASMPMYEYRCGLASLDPPPPEMAQLFQALVGNQPEIDRFFGVMAGTVAVPEFFSPDSVRRILSAALPTGRAGRLPAAARTGR